MTTQSPLSKPHPQPKKFENSPKQFKLRLLDQVRDVIRAKHYNIRTEHTYIEWIRHFIFFHNKQHPTQLGEPQINQFLTHLTVDRKVTSSAQNQALCGFVILYRHVLMAS